MTLHGPLFKSVHQVRSPGFFLCLQIKADPVKQTKDFSPVDPAEILRIMGTILRESNQNQPPKKEQRFYLMSSDVNLRSSGHLRVIFLSEAFEMAAD